MPLNDGTPNLKVTPGQGFAFCNCNNIFFNRWDNIEQAVYDEGYAKKYNTETISKYLKRYAAVYGEKMLDLTTGRKFLEVGCINTSLIDEFRAMGFDTTANDIFDHDFNGHKFLLGDFEKVLIEDESFDVIFASHVFEHFKNPVDALSKAFDALKPGGLLFIAMPNPYFIDWRQPYAWGHWHTREHHIMWDKDSFVKVAEAKGFKKIFANHNFNMDFICNGDMHILLQKEGTADAVRQ